ncbi:hypothetical protein ACOY72_04880 [Acinetobacter seifertii]|uniref:hypothetical protein n=1 Tax=Acinetobacter seifertii TaxID=1530123 RepID=UPI003BD61332
MKKIILLGLICLSSSSWAEHKNLGACEISKDKIIIGDVGLGRSVKELVSKDYRQLKLENDVFNKIAAKEYRVSILNRNNNIWLGGQPISDFNFITYDPKNYKILSFGLSLTMDDFPVGKVKDALTTLYGLPKVGWNLTQESDPKYGEVNEYHYRCKDYVIDISQSGLGTSIRMYDKGGLR